MATRTVSKLGIHKLTVLLVRDVNSLLVMPVLLLFYLLAAIVAFSTSLYAADAIPGEQWCDRPVAAIKFSGNKVTRDHVIRRELVQYEGADCSLDDIIDGIQNIQDLGLFKSVWAELELKEQELELRYFVNEKIYFLPIPRFSRTSDGELRYGGQLRWDNFLGRLHQVKVTTEKRQEDNGRGRSGFVHRLDYNVPRFFGSRYGARVHLSGERRNTELDQDDVVFGEALRDTRRVEFRLARWANGLGGLQGLSYFGGAGFEYRKYEIQSGTAGPFTDGNNLFLTAGLDIQNVHKDTFRRRGTHHSLFARFADRALGSDFSYTRIDARMRWFIPLRRAQTNLNIQWRLGLSTSAPFGERTYSIGGADILRGMRTGEQTGNISNILNIEYLSGFFSYPQWRWLVFSDVGNVYRTGEVDLTDLEIRAGAGLRWKLVDITNTDVRIDVAWDPDRQKLTPYISTSVTF